MEAHSNGIIFYSRPLKIHENSEELIFRLTGLDLKGKSANLVHEMTSDEDHS